MKYTVVALIACLSLVVTVSVAQQLNITGQKPLQVEQDKSINIGLSDVIVEADSRLNYPHGFYLEIDDGKDYSVNGETITPSPGFTGTLKVKVRVTNGSKKSGKHNLKIKVVKSGASDGDNDGDGDDNGGDNDDDDDDDGDDDNDDGDDNGGSGKANQKPSVVSQVAVQIKKNQSFQIELGHLVVSDPDNDYPDDFTLKVVDGDNYTVSARTVTPAADFVGALSIKIYVNDGKIDSDAFAFLINVKDTPASNMKPVITAQSSLATFKNEALTIKLTNLSVTDPDDNYPSDFILIVLNGTNYSVSGNTITPSTGFTGTLTVKVKVNDGNDDSGIFELKINVIERGTLQIVGQIPIIIPEDSAYIFKPGDLNVSDPSDSYPSGFDLTIASGANYSVEGLKVKPKRDFNGNLMVPVRVAKGGALSNTYQALIIVRPVNDAPVFSTFDTSPISVATHTKCPF